MHWTRKGLDWTHANDLQCAPLWNGGSAGWSNLGLACVGLRLTLNGTVVIVWNDCRWSRYWWNWYNNQILVNVEELIINRWSSLLQVLSFGGIIQSVESFICWYQGKSESSCIRGPCISHSVEPHNVTPLPWTSKMENMMVKDGLLV